MTTSMVNLSGNSNSNFVNSLRKTPDFGMSTEHPFFLYFFTQFVLYVLLTIGFVFRTPKSFLTFFPLVFCVSRHLSG